MSTDPTDQQQQSGPYSYDVSQIPQPTPTPNYSLYAYGGNKQSTHGDYLAPPAVDSHYPFRLRWSDFSLGRRLVVIGCAILIGSFFFPWITIRVAFLAPISLSESHEVVILMLALVLSTAVLPLWGKRFGMLINRPDLRDSAVILLFGLWSLSYVVIRSLGLIKYADIGLWIAYGGIAIIIGGGWMMWQNRE